MDEKQDVQVEEVMVLSKFEGESTDPADEVERVTIQDGTVVAHEKVENGEVAGPVEGSDLVGKTGLGLFTNTEKEVD